MQSNAQRRNPFRDDNLSGCTASSHTVSVVHAGSSERPGLKVRIAATIFGRAQRLLKNQCLVIPNAQRRNPFRDDNLSGCTASSHTVSVVHAGSNERPGLKVRIAATIFGRARTHRY
jgi:hypothetical protein